MSTVEGIDGLVFVDQVALAVPLQDVMRELIPDLLGYFLNRLDDREDAADAVAETLLVLWRKERAVPAGTEDARRYAFGVARKILITARRGRRRYTALADRLRVLVREEIVPGPEVDIELRTALGSLTDHDRELLLLVAWEGFLDRRRQPDSWYPTGCRASTLLAGTSPTPPNTQRDTMTPPRDQPTLPSRPTSPNPTGTAGDDPIRPYDIDLPATVSIVIATG